MTKSACFRFDDRASSVPLRILSLIFKITNALLHLFISLQTVEKKDNYTQTTGEKKFFYSEIVLAKVDFSQTSVKIINSCCYDLRD